MKSRKEFAKLLAKTMIIYAEEFIFHYSSPFSVEGLAKYIEKKLPDEYYPNPDEELQKHIDLWQRNPNLLIKFFKKYKEEVENG